MQNKNTPKFIVCATILSIQAFAGTGPCDIYASAKTPCVAAHSTVRALFENYAGNLYQVRRADGSTKDIPVSTAGGYADISVQDDFCNGTTCTISILYDQTSYKNDLVKSPKVYWLDNGGKEASASAAEIKVNGHKVHGIYRTAWSTIAYRNNSTTGIATGNDAESMYMVVDGKHYNDQCCFDYGNAETSGNDDGNGTMEAVYWGNDVQWGGYGMGNGPWVAADLENGVFKGNEGGYLWGTSHTTPWSTALSVVADFATVMLKGPSDATFKLKAGDAQTDSLTTMWDGARPSNGYSPKKLQGAIILGSGGDGSDGAAGTFFEGAMTIGNPPDSIDKKIQANIAAAGYGSSIEKEDTVPQAPYADTLVIPGTIQAEDYDVGGQGGSYSDNESTNQGGVYREDGVDIVGDATDGYKVGYTVAGEWLEYTVNVQKSDFYTFEARLSSGSDNSSFRFFLDNVAITDTVAVSNGDSWDIYSTVTGKTSSLTAGTHVLKLAITGSYVNIDWVQFTEGTMGMFSSPAANSLQGSEDFRIYNLGGTYLGTFRATGISSLHTEMRKSDLNSGVYLVRTQGGKFNQFIGLRK
jgi:non-reducing end alpha-L-arabinofuranosidase